MESPLSRLGDHVRIETGKLDANASDPEGEYPFFTCASNALRISSFSYDCECVLVAGNGDLNVKYYKGKFDAYQRTYIIESCDADSLDVRYLFHFLSVYVHRLREMSIGGVIKYIKMGYLTDAKIPLPPVAKQRRIAAVLDKAEELRANRRRGLDQLDALSQSLFLAMFGDPVTNPKGFDKKPLGSLASKIGSGATPVGGDSAYKAEGIALIRSMNVRNGLFLRKDLARIDGSQAAKLSNVEVLPDDVLLNITGASVARVCRVPIDVLPARVNQHVCIIRTGERLSTLFLERLLLFPSIKEKLLQLGDSGGATRQAITKGQIEAFDVILPSVSEQRRFAEQQTMVERMWRKQEEFASDADLLFESLQHQAFTGAHGW